MLSLKFKPLCGIVLVIFLWEITEDVPPLHLAFSTLCLKPGCLVSPVILRCHMPTVLQIMLRHCLYPLAAFTLTAESALPGRIAFFCYPSEPRNIPPIDLKWSLCWLRLRHATGYNDVWCREYKKTVNGQPRSKLTRFNQNGDGGEHSIQYLFHVPLWRCAGTVMGLTQAVVCIGR